ncbi:SseB family protein [Microbacterium sp. SS28]|uniref:SseB family protein n=1 Tax=Microbacterium sp. SS28 TaxID=2919948 RepID=UPI001FA978A6|nr:SseB family protein [Microbacterium sp. SS28]
MALFSRRSKQSSDPVESSEPTETPAPASPDAVADVEPTPAPDAVAAAADEEDAATDAAATDAAAAASVGISVSSYRGMGATPPAPPVRPAAPVAPQRVANETAPPVTETLPGLRDNVLLADALSKLPARPTPPQIVEVARQLLQGQLILRVKGDARSLLSQGAQPPLAVVKLGEETFVVAYSTGGALAASVRADGDTDTSAMGQSSAAVIRYVLASPHAGMLIDPASSPATAVLRREMLEKMLEGIDPASSIKTLLAGERTPATAAAVSEALTHVPFWVAVSRVEDSDRLGIAESRTTSGERFIELFSHPLEVVALGRGDRPAPMTGEQLGKALRSDPELTGVVIDSAGPWIRLTRSDLAVIVDA